MKRSAQWGVETARVNDVDSSTRPSAHAFYWRRKVYRLSSIRRPFVYCYVRVFENGKGGGTGSFCHGQKTIRKLWGLAPSSEAFQLRLHFRDRDIATPRRACHWHLRYSTRQHHTSVFPCSHPLARDLPPFKLGVFATNYCG